MKESSQLAAEISSLEVNQDAVELVVFPTIAALTDLQKYTIVCGVQSVDEHDGGAYTGETTFNIVKDLNVQYALVGHSERRVHHGVTDEEVAFKAQKLIELGITPIICIGENAEQRNAGETDKVIAEQIASLDTIDLSQVILAYEPIWAISGFGGTESASFEDIVPVAKFIHTQYDGERVPLLYGGSVKSDIEEAYFQSTDIDGFLVGSASTQLDQVTELYSRLRESQSNS